MGIESVFWARMNKRYADHLILILLAYVLQKKYNVWLDDSNKISNCSWLYLSEWTLLLGAVYSSLRVLGFDTLANTFNSALLHPISTFSSIERTSVLLLGNGILRNNRFDDDNLADLGLLAFITLYSLVEAKIAKVPVSQVTSQLLMSFEIIYSIGIMYHQAKRKTWPYGYMESAGPVNFLFVTVPVHMILIDALHRNQESLF